MIFLAALLRNSFHLDLRICAIMSWIYEFEEDMLYGFLPPRMGLLAGKPPSQSSLNSIAQERAAFYADDRVLASDAATNCILFLVLLSP